MKILKAYPPNFAAIKKAFPVVTGAPGIIYAWGDRVYNPTGDKLPTWVKAHEQVHMSQQADMQAVHEPLERAVERWWVQYIRSMAFRYIMELPAHRTEYQTFLRHNRTDPKGRYLRLISQRLSGPLYGHLVTEEEAAAAILKVSDD